MGFTHNLLIGGFFGIFFITIYEYFIKMLSKRRKKELKVRLKGFHIHHSIYGAILIIISLFVDFSFLLGAGSGIIIKHAYNEKKFSIIDRT